ncbi:DUF4935 domain-containing protein [Paenibacillus albidus]|uniref:PIN domain-containing protein n=1 Tax=Paenibacillus albidus TaxID=2041023 RepID=UPI001BE85C0F|nr:PIN domain-containing protein [Paenibacillus albidus]MBT2291461.1 DUF4935 domain-containing protein [Paenibacillus albidus]
MGLDVLNVVIDTCVWIDLATGKFDEGILTLLEKLVSDYHNELIVPAQLAFEWNKNKEERIVEKTAHHLNSAKNTIREALKIAKSTSKSEIIDHLSLSMTSLEELKTEIQNKYSELCRRIDDLLNHPKTKHINLSEAKKSSLIDEVLENKELFFRLNLKISA